MGNIYSLLSSLLANTGDIALKSRAREIVINLSPQPGDKIIDIGCGDGYYLHLLSNLRIRNLHLTGTDFDRAGLAKTCQNIPDPKIKIYPGDLMAKLPFPDNSFDKAVMSEVAEHLPDDVRGLKEVHRILKPGAVLCLTVPHANYPFLWDPLNWLLERFLGTHVKSGFFAGIWNQHIRLYHPAEIQASLTAAGFKIEKISSLTFWCLPFNHYLINLVARYLSRRYKQGRPNVSLNKFTLSSSQSGPVSLAFKLVNLLDKLNDLYQPADSGVSVFVQASKL